MSLSDGQRAAAWDKSTGELSPDELAYIQTAGQMPETQEVDMPEETAEEREAREAAEASAGEGQSEIEAAKAEAAQAREEAEAAKAEANAEKATAAEARVEAAEQRATAAEEKAKAAAADSGEGKTYSQEYVKKLRDEAAKRRIEVQEEKEARKKAEDELKSEAERKEERASSAELRAEEAEKKLMIYEVASKKGVPPELASRLVGDTIEALEKDADQLLKTVKPSTGQGLDQGARGRAGDKPADMNSWLRQSAGVTAQ